MSVESHISAASIRSSTMLCCICGLSIVPNETSLCDACLRSETDLTQNIPRHISLAFCSSCERYLQPPDTWIRAQLESRELLALCLRRLSKCLSSLRLVDASFIWTEPHSRRIRVKICVQKYLTSSSAEIAANGTSSSSRQAIEQTLIIEYIVHPQMCPACHRLEAKDFWKALVQLRMRDKSTHHLPRSRKTLYYLEQVILRHAAHRSATNITHVHDGMNLYFGQEAQAKRFVSFVQGCVPCRVQHSRQLVSHDINSNVYNYKFTYSVQIVPVCRGTVVCLSHAMARRLANMSPVCVVHRVTNVVTLVDPATGALEDVRSEMYWRDPFHSISHVLTEYIVMDIEQQPQAAQGTRPSSRDVWVTPSSQLGRADAHTHHTRTHLGTLRVGDTVLGLHLATINCNDRHLEAVATHRLPDVVLVKRALSVEQRAHRRRRRRWRLRRLRRENREGDSTAAASETADGAESDYDEFLDDLEEVGEMRENVNIYKDRRLIVDEDDIGVEDIGDIPQISLQEMINDLDLDDPSN